MRPIATDQDILRFPLNEVLGAEANVRLLRVLADDVVGPISVPDAAEKTGLTEAGARRALRRLEKTGFIQRFGGGHSKQFVLRDSDLVTDQLRDLFRCERERHQALFNGIREVFDRFSEIQVSWIDAAPSQPGQPLHLGVQSDSRSLTYLNEEIRKRIVGVENDFDVTIEVHTFSKADTPNIPWERTEILTGHMPETSPDPNQRARGHDARERRAARLSETIARLLDQDPSIIKRAQKHLERLLTEDHGPATHDLREWEDILKQYSPRRIREFLVSETPRAERLRQSSPFFAVLTAEERDELLADLETGR
ncbi:MAG: hypothetical protein ACQET1_03620 [Gemmatimonadota bacterium]